MTPAPDHQLRKLLLRQLPPEDVAHLEAAILMENGVAERLREEEFDLIDDYVHGRLTPADRSDMERYVLTTPERVVSLRAARALAAQRPAAAPQPAPSASRTPWKSNRVRPLATLLAAGLAAVALIPHGGSTLVGGSAPAARLSLRPPEAAAPAQIVMLLTDADRGGSKPVVHLASDTVAVRLQAEVPGPPRNVSYSIQVDDAAGRRVFEGSDLATHVAGPYRFVEVTVPAQALGPGARTLWLRAAGAAGGAPPDYRWQIDTVRDGDAQKK